MAAVVGAPDPKWGEIVRRAIKLKPGSSVDQAELIAHCKTFLPASGSERIDFRDQMPMSSSSLPADPEDSSDDRRKFEGRHRHLVAKIDPLRSLEAGQELPCSAPMSSAW